MTYNLWESGTLINMKDERKPIAIIIPVRNSGTSLKMTIDSILQNFVYPFKIHLIESESTDGTAQYCNAMAIAYPDKIAVHHVKAEGTTLAINYGLRVTGDSDVLLTQDDVVFHRFLGRDLLYEFMVAKKEEKMGIGTVINGGGMSGENYCDGFKWVGTWCMFIPRRTIDKIGMFDEMLNPGDGDDIDYSMAVYRAGLNVFTSTLFVEHHRKFNIDQHEHESQKIKKRNSAYFKKKWGLDKPADILSFGLHDVKRKFDRFTLLDEGYCFDKLGFIHHDIEVFDTVIKVTKEMKEDDIYIDVGAGVGDTSLFIDKGTCFAFEPSDRCYKHLLGNMKLNPNSKVIPIKLAVYDKSIHYEVVKGDHYGLDEIKETKDITKPKTIVLDEMFKEVDNIKLLKIDAEGSDFNVLKGAKELIKKNRPIIVIEVSHTNKEEVENFLTKLDYDLSASKGENCVALPKEQINEKDTV